MGFGYKELVKYLMKDKEQIKTLKILSEYRNIPLKYLVRRGIFCIPDTDELSYLLEEWNMTFEEFFGKDISSVKLLNEGYIIPVLDSSYRIRFFVNYNWERGKARKYLNVFPDNFIESSKTLKMFGMHNMSQGIKEDWIVLVEGMFDVIRLESEGIPTVALMGNKLLEYHKIFLKRFNKVVYISDTDFMGILGWKKVRKGLDNVIHYPIKGLSKDVDEFAVEDTLNYKEWLKGLKMHRGR